MALFDQHEWYYTPSQHGSQQQQQHPRDPSEDPHFEAVTPPPPPAIQPVMPDPPRRRRSGARMSTRGGEFHFSTPRHSSGSHYPSVPEEGPSSPAQEANSAPVARNSPPFGDDRPVPPYGTAYNPFEPTSHAHYNYNYERDPYVVAARYDARYPDRAHGPPGAPDYSAHGYPAPPRPPIPVTMADPNGVNSHTNEDDYDNAQVHLTGAQLKALIDEAVQAALDRQYTESHSRSVTKPLSKPKSQPKPPSQPKKDDDKHSSAENSVHRDREYTDASGAKGCTYKCGPSEGPKEQGG
ncbi:leucine-rich repeat extensin-like protein 5 [Helianthus annuus]|uniref:leucine-rich repeat extensin-like protein 5 n=1 Tax=Helianthus annuus TaxID=4232 RepID=UPI0016531CCD|nr:leucine-rich repeat extensin-like protein 5 [Helianthus annuus]